MVKEKEKEKGKIVLSGKFNSSKTYLRGVNINKENEKDFLAKILMRSK